MVHVHVGKDVGHRQRMGDIGFATAPALTIVGLLGVVVGPADQVDLIRSQIGRDAIREDVEITSHGGTSCQQHTSLAAANDPARAS